MKNFFTFLLITIYISFCSAQITHESHMKDVFAHFENADSNTLAVFDVDMVLIQPSDPAFQMPTMKRYKSVIKQVMKDVTDETIFLSLMVMNSPSILIDEQTPQLLADLQQKGVYTMACTANITGALGKIPHMTEWRIHHLNKLGLNFSEQFSQQAPLIFSHLPSYRGYYPEYKDGILFTNGSKSSKGIVFIEFLKQSGLHPTTIVFVDDREDNLKSVEEALQQFDSLIHFKGIHYTGALHYPSIDISEKQFEEKWQNLAHESNSFSNE